jgi:hypothetical protein
MKASKSLPTQFTSLSAGAQKTMPSVTNRGDCSMATGEMTGDPR